MALIMGCVSLGFGVYAKPLTYKLWVNGEQFDEFTLSIKCGDGTATFDPVNNELTLDNVEITKGYTYDAYNYGKAAIYSELKDLTVTVCGYCFIDLADDLASDGIDVASGCNVTVCGAQSESEYDYNYLSISKGIFGFYLGNFTEGGDLTVKDVSIDITDTEYSAIMTSGDISLENAGLRVERLYTGDENGVVLNGSVYLNDYSYLSIVNRCSCILLGTGDSTEHNITVDGGSILQVYSMDGYGIEFVRSSLTSKINGELNFQNGTIAAQCSNQRLCTNLPADKIVVPEGKEILYTCGNLTSNNDTIARVVNTYKGFPDVKTDKWYFNAVKYNAQVGLMSGYSTGLFGPSDHVKRQDFVVILARLSGVDLSKYDTKERTRYSDVNPNAYYAPAIRWADSYGIISGYKNGKFGVGDSITREQICTIFFAYGTDGTFEYDFDVNEVLAPYKTDKHRISSWAREGVAWCINEGLISGKNATSIAPLDSASRAEIAQIFMNYDQALVTWLLYPEDYFDL